MRKLPTAIEATALNHPFVYINGGQRGLQVRLSPHDAKLASQAVAVHVIA
jgi:Cys-tRNA(Pro)/Cys-tRNA(Cys) deacylase